MESKPSLVEISGENDSLLQQSPINDISIFNCSPLRPQIPYSLSSISSSPLSFSSFSISRSGNTGSQVKESVPSYSNKENLCNNENKSGVSNLSVEPLKMKRSKKAGGYNLRKSLVWDRAFFTEEGVLNDSELFLISGTTGDRDSFSVTDQQGKDSSPVKHGSVCGSADTVNKEDSMVLSGFPNKRNATSSSYMKRDSSIGGSLPSVSKSSKNVPPSHGLKKTSQGELCSSPVASASQKRLRNPVTRKIITRSSKIPKVPISRRTSCVPSMTPLPNSSGGSSLNCTDIAQSASRKSLSSNLQPKNLQSKTKNVSGGAKLLEPVPKCGKHSADVKNESTNSTVPLPLKAENTTKMSKCSEIQSSQGPGGTIKHNDRKISDAVMPNLENAGLNQKNIRDQGAKPSGLRLPSPSLRFFSETKASVPSTSLQVNPTRFNVLKSNIPTSKNSKVAEHIHDIKPPQDFHVATNVDAMGKGGMCFRKSDNCSTSSIVAPIVNAKEKQVKNNQQRAKLRVQQIDKNPEPKNDKQGKDKVASSVKAEESSTKDNISNSFEVEFKEASSATILFHDTSTNRRMLNDSHECCPEVELIKASETDTEADTRRLEDVDFNSSVTNIDVMRELQTISNNKLMLDSNGDLSSSVLDNNVPNGSDRFRLDHTCSQSNFEVQLDERNLLLEGSLVKVGHDHYVVEACTHDNGDLQNIAINCNADSSLAVGSTYEHLDVEGGGENFDRNLLSAELSGGSEKQDKTIELSDNKNSTNSDIKDDQDKGTVSLEVLEQPGYMFSNLSELSNEDTGDIVHWCKPDQGEEQFQSSSHGLIDNGDSSHGASIAYHQTTEKTEYNYSEEDKQQVLDNDLLAEEMMLQNNSQYDIDKVNSCTEKVEENDLRCPSNNANSSFLQTTHVEFQSSEARTDADEFSCDKNKHELPPRDVLMSANFEGIINSDEAVINSSPREAEAQTSVNDGLADTSNCNTEDVDNGLRITKQNSDDQKLIRLPSNVVPFSEEWLAAIESAGEEILTLKTGPVKHSPPDKSIPEPSPWSPVKKKSNQVIGPFDCTKYTNG